MRHANWKNIKRITLPELELAIVVFVLKFRCINFMENVVKFIQITSVWGIFSLKKSQTCDKGNGSSESRIMIVVLIIIPEKLMSLVERFCMKISYQYNYNERFNYLT